MPHFDDDDRDEVFEKDSKESKEFKENGEEMDVDDDQVNIFGFFTFKIKNGEAIIITGNKIQINIFKTLA